MQLFCFALGLLAVCGKQLVGAPNSGVVGCKRDDCSLLANQDADLDYPIPRAIATPVVYVLWFGDWPQASKDLIKNLLRKIGSTNYLKILKAYQLGFRSTKVTGNVAWGKEASMVVTEPLKLSSADPIFAYMNKTFPRNKNGIYLGLSSANIEVNGGCDTCSRITYVADDKSPFDTSYRMAWIGNLANQCAQANACTANGPNGNPGLDALIQNMMMRFVSLITIPFFNDGLLTTSELCYQADTIKTPQNGGEYNIVVNGMYYLLSPLVEFRANGQFCAMQPFCTGMSALGYNCLSLFDHPSHGVLASGPLDLISLATKCRTDSNCIGFTSQGELKQIVAPIVSSTSVDLYVKKCVCSACGSGSRRQDFASCGRANTTCSASKKLPGGCWAKFTGLVGNQECVCEDQAETHGIKCSDAIRITAGGGPRVFSNVAAPVAATAPMRGAGVCEENGHVLYFNVTVQPGSVCTVTTCGSSSGFDSILSVYSSCSAKTFVACDDDGADDSCGRGLSTLSFDATQSSYIIGVGTYNANSAGQFTLSVDCVL